MITLITIDCSLDIIYLNAISQNNFKSFVRLLFFIFGSQDLKYLFLMQGKLKYFGFILVN